MSYARFERMVDAARPYPGLGRLFLGVVTTLVLAFLWMAGLVWLTSVAMGTPFGQGMQSLLQPGAPSPVGTALYLLLIVGIGIGAMVSAALWQKRAPGTLFGPAARTLRHFVIAAGLSLSVMLILGVLSLPFIERPVLNMNPMAWLVWLPLGILVVAAQTGSEELLFRGYLQSQLGARFASPLVWLLLPALLFGAIHYQPTLPTGLLVAILVIATVFGLLAADLTARTGSIGAAWGFHFANNALVILLIATETSLTGLSLLRTGSNLDALGTLSPLIAVEVLTLTAIWALLRKALAS